MRADIESAMAHVITSPSAALSFAADPAGMAAALGLIGEEAEVLAAMSGDLIALSPSFVNKRERTLRWWARRTLELLEDIGDGLLSDFIESSSPDDRPGSDLTAFADFLVERTASLVEELEFGELLAEMARYEQHWCRCFVGATRPFGEHGLQRTQTAGPQFDQDTSLRFAPGASLGHFGWDLRQTAAFSVDALAVLPPDPCDLLFFHTGRADGIRVVRVGAIAAAALGRLAESGSRPTTARLACAGLEIRGDHEALLGPFIHDGALELA